MEAHYTHCPDYFGIGVLCNHPEFLIRSANIWLYGTGASVLGYQLYNSYHDETDYHMYELAARITGITCLGIMSVSLLITKCTLPRQGFHAPFARATMDLAYIAGGSHPHSHLSIANEKYTFGFNVDFCKTLDHVNQVRSPATFVHLIFITFYLIFWFGINDIEQNDADALRVVENILMIREIGFVLLLVLPTFSVAIVDFGQMKLSDRPHEHSRLWWAIASLLHKTLIYVALRFVVNPTSDLLHPHGEPHEAASDWETISLVATTTIIGGLALCFWMMYHGWHLNTTDKPFAYLDFPSTLVLVMAYTWCLNARLSNHHGALSAGFDFFVSTAYVILVTIGILNIPSNHDFVHSRSMPPEYSEVSKTQAEVTTNSKPVDWQTITL